METLNFLAGNILENLEKNRLPIFDILSRFLDIVKGMSESEIQDSSETVDLYSLCLERHEHPLYVDDNIDSTAFEEVLPDTINQVTELIKRVVERAISVRNISDEEIEDRLTDIKDVLDRQELLRDLVEKMTSLWMPLEPYNNKYNLKKEELNLLKEFIENKELILNNIKFDR